MLLEGLASLGSSSIASIGLSTNKSLLYSDIFFILKGTGMAGQVPSVTPRSSLRVLKSALSLTISTDMIAKRMRWSKDLLICAKRDFKIR